MVEIASGACSLCHKSSTCYTHAINMDKRSYKSLCDVEGMTIQKEAYIHHKPHLPNVKGQSTSSYHDISLNTQRTTNNLIGIVCVIVTALPWVAASVIMEGMFMVQTEPFFTMKI